MNDPDRGPGQRGLGTTQRLDRRGEGVLASLGYVIGSTVVIRAGSLVFAVLLRRVLAASLVGVWNLIEIVVSYLSTLTLGVGYSADRRLPFHRAKEDPASVQRMRDSLLGWSLVEAVLVGGGVLTFVLLVGDQVGPNTRQGLYWTPLLFLAQKLLNVYLVLLRGSRAFRLLSFGNVLQAVLDWSLVAWAYWGGLPGVFVGGTLAAFLKLIYFHAAERRVHRAPMRPRADWEGLRSHFPYAPTFAAYKALGTLAERADSILVGALFGTGALAYYFLGFQFSRVAMEIPFALTYIAFPHVMEKYAQSNGGPAFSEEFFRFLRLALFLFVPMILPLAFFGSELVVRSFLPDYERGLFAIQLIVLTGGMLVARQLHVQVLMARQRLAPLLIGAVAYLPAFGLTYLALRAWVQDGLALVAIAAFAAYAFHLAYVAWSTRNAINRADASGLTSWLSDLGVCLLWAALLLAIDAVPLPPVASGLPGAVALFAARCLAFGLLAMPICYFGLGQELRKRTGRYLARALGA